MGERRFMEAVVLLTTHWKLTAEAETLLFMAADRSMRDRAPAFLAVTAGILGPYAWLSGLVVVNEIIMRRVDHWGALTKDMPDGFAMAKAVLKHHIFRMIIDMPRELDLSKCYEVKSGLSAEDLQRIVADGSHADYVSGHATDFSNWM